MSRNVAIEKLETQQIKKDRPVFHIGDTVRVHTRIIEGEKERIQVFTGTVIARKGAGLSETFSVHRVAYGEGMERVFLLNSPRIAKIEITKKGHVRRAKLYYLRGTSGKAAKVRGKHGPLNKGNEARNSNENGNAEVAQDNIENENMNAGEENAASVT